MPATPHTTLPAARHKLSTYRTLLYTFVGFTLIGIGISFFLTLHLKQQAIEQLAEIQAEKEADIVFKALWQGMLQGWDKDRMNHFIHSLELNSDQKVQLVRSAIVDRQFGPSDASALVRHQDPHLQQAMQTGQTYIGHSEGELRYLYPIVASEVCLGCHTQSHAGAVHGVIDIRFSDQPMQLLLSDTFNIYIATVILTLITLCLILFTLIRLQIVQPLRLLSHQIREAVQDDLSVTRIDAEHYRLREPFQLALSFNQLAQELDDYHQQLKNNSYLDALTGLYNRRYLNEQLPNLLTRSRAAEQPLTVMLIDLDRFKAINDTYGHEAGDLALKYFAQRLQRRASNSDLVLRLGGDEFVIVLPNTDISGALSIKRRLTDDLNNKRADLGVVNLHLEASIGYATYPQDASDLDQLLHQADQGMYHDKLVRRQARQTEAGSPNRAETV